MKFYKSFCNRDAGGCCCGGMDRIVYAAGAPPQSMVFFVTSAKSKTGNLAAWRARIGFAKLWRPPWGKG